MKNSTKGGLAALAISILVMQGLVHQASATNLSTSISANPVNVVKNQQSTLAAKGTVAMTSTGDKLSPSSTYFIYVEFWKNGPVGNDFVNGCATVAYVDAKHPMSSYSCTAQVHPSKDVGFIFGKKTVTYYAKVTAKRDSVTHPKSVTTTTSKNTVTINCLKC